MNLLIAILNSGVLFRSEKVYTVMTVILLIWVGIVVYLLLTNKKISKLEKELKKK